MAGSWRTQIARVLSRRQRQAVMIHVAEPQDAGSFGLDLLEDPIEEALQASGVGEWGGHEIAADSAVIYLYGSDADLIAKTIIPVLDAAPTPAGTYLIVRRGGPGAPETRISRW